MLKRLDHSKIFGHQNLIHVMHQEQKLTPDKSQFFYIHFFQIFYQILGLINCKSLTYFII